MNHFPRQNNGIIAPSQAVFQGHKLETVRRALWSIGSAPELASFAKPMIISLKMPLDRCRDRVADEAVIAIGRGG